MEKYLAYISSALAISYKDKRISRWYIWMIVVLMFVAYYADNCCWENTAILLEFIMNT